MPANATLRDRGALERNCILLWVDHAVMHMGAQQVMRYMVCRGEWASMTQWVTDRRAAQ